MSNSTLFFTQMVSLMAFVGGLFVLYRLLVKQKDATIELLQGRIEFLTETMNRQGSDTLVENLDKRIVILNEELDRLNKDKYTNKERIEKKEKELTEMKDVYDRLQRLVAHSSLMPVSYFCPECEQPTLAEVESKVDLVNKKKNDVFKTIYRCGHTEVNGKVVNECRHDLHL